MTHTMKVLGILALSLMLCSCSQSDYQKADMAYVAIDGALAIGQGLVPELVASGKITAANGNVLNAQLGQLAVINDAYKSCIDNVLQAKLATGQKFLDCLNLLAQSFYNNPQAAAALKYTNPQTVAEYNLVVTVVSKALAIAVAQFGGMTPPAPVIQSLADGTPVAPAKTSEIHALENQVRAGL